MNALTLFDIVLADERRTERSTEVALELIQYALAEIRHIRNLDQKILRPNEVVPDRGSLTLLRGMYNEWCQSVEGLLVRIARLEETHGPLAGAKDLRDAHGRTRAMLNISLARLERDREEGKRPGIPIGEVRGALRLGTH